MNLNRIAARIIVVALLTGLAALAWAQGVADLRLASDPAFQAALDRVVHDAGLDNQVRAGRLAVALVDITQADAPRLAMANGDKLMYAASLPKIAILFGALVEAERGHFPINDTTIDALTRMIRYSSNEDATQVLNWVGREHLIEILQSDQYKFYDATTGGGLWVGKGYGKEAAFRRDPLGNLSHAATVFQVARMYYLLAQNALLSPKSNRLMMDILSKPGIRHKFVKALAGVPGAKIYRKSGTWKEYHADSALVEYQGCRYIMVGIAEHPQGGEWLERLGLRMHALVVNPVTPGR